MKLNTVEKALLNNPVRATLQRRYEAALLQRLGGDLEAKRVLEICSSPEASSTLKK